MTEDGSLKSAYELAMEKLTKQDADAGVEHRELTDDQRSALAEARNYCDAKLAEREVLHQSELMRTVDPEARVALDAHYRRDRDRLIGDRDAKIDRIRRG